MQDRSWWTDMMYHTKHVACTSIWCKVWCGLMHMLWCGWMQLCLYLVQLSHSDRSCWHQAGHQIFCATPGCCLCMASTSQSTTDRLTAGLMPPETVRVWSLKSAFNLRLIVRQKHLLASLQRRGGGHDRYSLRNQLCDLTHRAWRCNWETDWYLTTCLVKTGKETGTESLASVVKTCVWVPVESAQLVYISCI